MNSTTACHIPIARSRADERRDHQEGISDGIGFLVHQVLVFELCAYSDKVTMDIVLGPGDEKLRSDIFNWLREQEPPLQKASGDGSGKHQCLYKDTLLSRNRLEELQMDKGEEAMVAALDAEIRKHINRSLLPIADSICESSWFRKIH